MKDRIHVLNTPVVENKERLKNVGAVLVLGANGLVGSRFKELFGEDNFITPSHEELDITNAQAVREYVQEYKPKFIVNFSAYTNVNEAEKQKNEDGTIDTNGEAWKINVEGTRNIVNAIDPEVTQYIHISTDMVLSGNTGPYNESKVAETDPNKLTVYGFTKAEAERVVLDKLGKEATIVRIIYPSRAKYEKKLDYLRGFLSRFDSGNLKEAFADQRVSITDVDELCEALTRVIERKVKGVLHITSSDTGTPYEIVTYLLQRTRGFKGEIDTGSLSTRIQEGKIKPSRYELVGGLKGEDSKARLDMRSGTWRETIDKLVSQGLGS